MQPTPAPGLDPRDFNAEQIYLVSRRAVIPVLKHLVAAQSKTGLFPSILGGPDDLRLLQDGFQFAEEADQTTELVLEAAETFSVDAWLTQAAKQRLADAETKPQLLEDVGKWPLFGAPRVGLIAHEDAPREEVYVGNFRVDASWKIPGKLMWSAINYDMGPELHCAFHKRWSAKYGSEVIASTGSVIQCHVKHPPRTRADAIQLAWEHYYYCYDIVSQGCGSVSNLAASLKGSEYWYFWWD